ANAVRWIADAGRDRDRLRHREPGGLERQERLLGAHADDARPVFHSVSLPVRDVSAAASRPDARYRGGGSSRSRRGPLVHRARLCASRRRGPRVAVRGKGRRRRDRIHAARCSTRQARGEASHSRPLGRAVEWNVASIVLSRTREFSREASSLAVFGSGRSRVPARRLTGPTRPAERTTRNTLHYYHTGHVCNVTNAIYTYLVNL